MLIIEKKKFKSLLAIKTVGHSYLNAIGIRVIGECIDTSKVSMSIIVFTVSQEIDNRTGY